MKQAIVIFPRKNKKVETIRKKYDPASKKFISHITLAFPFGNVNQKKLYKHIKDSLRNIKPFKIELKGIRHSKKEYYLYLLVKRGRKEILKIHKKLYSNLITKWLRKDIPYIPHITLGIFKTEKGINAAIKELKNKKLEIKTKINKIYLLTLNKNLTFRSYKVFRLKE
jgi:2'-5' RNA ligase